MSSTGSTSEGTTEQVLEKSVCNVVWYEGERLCEQELDGADQVSLVLQWFFLCLDVRLRGERKDVHKK